MLLDFALKSIIIDSNFPCLEPTFIVPKVFEPIKFDCIRLDDVVVAVVLLFYVHGTSKVMSGRSVNLTTFFLGRVTPAKRLTSTS